ncbi:MAG TPA: hypothetical protein VMY16_09320 [Ilumatobacteraceae bacterium]|nr:hypothetical protein [Ilumatobacteraceae bacterium]
MAEDEKENWIERNSKTITTLAAVSIPIVLAFFGYLANRQISQQQLNQEYVSLAIGILGEETNVNEAQTCKEEILRVESIEGKTARQVAEDLEDSPELRDLPKTLYRKWALDLLLESTPQAVQLTPAQYTGLLCGERLSAVTEPDDATSTEGNDQAGTDSVLFQRLVEARDDKGTTCLIVSSDTDTVGVGRVGEGNYEVTKTVELPTDDPGQEPTDVRYVNILDNSVWVLVGPTAQASADPCPPTTTDD